MTLDFNRVKSPGRRLAAALLVAVAGFGLAGCGDDTSVSGGGQTSGVRNAVGIVSGVVVDNNGNPIAGAQVTGTTVGKAGGKAAQSTTVTTNSAGHFTLAEVPVVNAVNGNGTVSSGTVAGVAFSMSIVAPAGYYGATVSVTPNAQVVSSENGGVIQGGETNPQLIWFDHFNADAGTIPLPRLGATIKGTLRDSTTGAALSGVVLRLDFTRFNPDQTIPGDNTGTQTSPSTIISYASGSTISLPAPGVTATNGNFTFTNVPEDSCVRLYAPDSSSGNGYNLTFDGSDADDVECNTSNHVESVNFIAISTNDENFVNLNQIFASASPNSDEVAPWVAAVDHATYVSGPCGTFDSTVTDTIVLNFSEPVSVDETALVSGENPITVLVGAFPNFTIIPVESADLSADGLRLTLVLAQDLPQTAEVTINIPVENVVDGGNNQLTAVGGGVDVDFDKIVTTVNGNSIENVVDQLCFNTFSPGSQPTDDFVIDQISPAQNDGEDLFETTSSLIDTVLTDEPNYAITEDVDGNGTQYPVFFGPATPGTYVTLTGDDTAVAASCSDGATTPTVVGAGATAIQTCPITEAFDYDDNDIEQFNAFQANPRVGDQLDNLATALNGGGTIDTHTHIARIHVGSIPEGTVNFAFALINPGTGQPKSALFFPVRTAAGGGDPTNLGEVADGKADACGDDCIVSINNGGGGWYSISPGGATEFDVIVAADLFTGVGNPNKPNPGDIVVAIARGQLGGNFVLGPASQVTLTDQVGPTVALQLLGSADAIAAASIFGQGGVVIQEATATPGAVILNITPQTGDTDESTGCQTGSTSNPGSNGFADGYYDDDFACELYLNSAVGGTAYVPAVRTDSAGQVRALTDATGMDYYFTNVASASGALNARIAIDVTEHVTLGPAAPPAVPVGGSAGLSQYIAIDSVPNESGNAFNDEVQFTVDDIFQLQADANSAGGASIDLTGAITDLQGNTLNTLCGIGPSDQCNDDPNAAVVLRDRFPPMIVAAFFDGLNTYVQYNEAITKSGVLTFIGCGGPAADLTDADVVLSADGTVVQIPIGVSGNPAGCFSGPGDDLTYAEDIYTSALVTSIAAAVGGDLATNTVPDPLTHAEIGSRDIPDAQGNVWDCTFAGVGNVHAALPGTYKTASGIPGTYCTGIPNIAGEAAPVNSEFVWAGAQLGIGGPTFEMVNIVGDFELTSSAPGFAAGATEFDFILQANHPIGNWFADDPNVPNPQDRVFDIAFDGPDNAGFGSCVGGPLGVANLVCDGEFVDDVIALTGTCAIDTALNTSSATFNADTTTVTFHIECTGPAVSVGNTVNVDPASDTVPPTDGAVGHNVRSVLNGQLQSVTGQQVTAN